MAPPAFWRKMPQLLRTEFDSEIRKRGYGDCNGLTQWLANKGFSSNKTAVHKYERRLREKDDLLSATDLPPETARAIVEAVALALKTIGAFSRVLDTLRDESAPD